MNENKIPTDREILTAWKARAFPRPPKGGCWPVAYCTDADMLEVIREARAAGRAEGREEQRGRTITTLGALYLRDLKAMFPDGYVDLAFRDGWKTALDYAEQAIREHGEGNG